jgi:mono/diheme cytochrome c family protein
VEEREESIMLRKALLAAGCILATSLSATAAEDAGKAEYMVACAGCHGESGLGQGPFAEYLNIPVPGLTKLAAANDGEFPFLKTFMVIDGRTGVRGHGVPMPIWGDRFVRSAVDSVGPYGAELVARGRILSLALYLESIQE